MTTTKATERCRSCGAPVEWRRTANGKWCPYDAGTETSHFQTCPDAQKWSKRTPPQQGRTGHVQSQSG